MTVAACARKSPAHCIFSHIAELSRGNKDSVKIADADEQECRLLREPPVPLRKARRYRRLLTFLPCLYDESYEGPTGQQGISVTQSAATLPGRRSPWSARGRERGATLGSWASKCGPSTLRFGTRKTMASSEGSEQVHTARAPKRRRPGQLDIAMRLLRLQMATKGAPAHCRPKRAEHFSFVAR